MTYRVIKAQDISPTYTRPGGIVHHHPASFSYATQSGKYRCCTRVTANNNGTALNTLDLTPATIIMRHDQHQLPGPQSKQPAQRLGEQGLTTQGEILLADGSTHTLAPARGRDNETNIIKRTLF
jgi:hypothetical protein